MLSSNTAYSGGGGAYGGTLNNCTLSGNTGGSPYYSGSGGGAACFSVLSHCTLAGNAAVWNGGGAQSCTLNNCTVTGNTAGNAGGGADSSVLSYCVLTDNSAYNGGGANLSALASCLISSNTAWGNLGGGANGGILESCTLTNNWGNHGGGAAGASLYNCLIVGNSSYFGGGVYSCQAYNCTLTGNTVNFSFGSSGGADSSTLNNCIVYYNTGNTSGNYNGGSFNYCCTTPLPGGTGNISDAPLFANSAGADFRLQTNSPCINVGNNSSVTNSADLDGRPRIVGGTVDIGAYEFQGVGMSEFIAWLQQYGLPTDGSADYTDADGDGLNNWQEWRAGTVPTNALSVLKMASATPTNNPPGLVVSWQSIGGIVYFLQSGTNLAALPAFSTIQSNIVGQAGTTTYTDTTATNGGPYYYRVGVQ